MIEISDLYKYYGARRALGPVSAQIQHGEIVGLLGQNGAGKTTALRILACDLLPSAGSVRVEGIDVVERPEAVRERIGYLPDRPPLYGDMRVGEYLAFAARLRGVASRDIARRVQAVEESTAVRDRHDDPISTLSHGYQQRVGIAQAIIHEPRLVVLDEPISGLDPVQIVEMRALVRSLAGKHTVLVSSHILSEISETCDRILVIKDGEIVASGTEAELSSQLLEGMRVRVSVRLPGQSAEAAANAARAAVTGLPSVGAVHAAPSEERDESVASLVVETSTDIRPALVAALAGGGLEIFELGRRHNELESVFLRLAGGEKGGAS
ncbi:MAG: ABC transporter ATP-binding protein [Deltaproteobacteria bacterium]|nr:ABC transporter ATP-binding protein [Deltaproteobacteria bacterium]